MAVIQHHGDSFGLNRILVSPTCNLQLRRRWRIKCVPKRVDRATAVLAAAGYNFSPLIRWFESLICALIATLLRAPDAARIA